MKKITPELLKRIKDAVNIVDVVGSHVVLRKTGANYTGLCPFHSERTPSFNVSENKQLYHCYGCRRGGDLVTFVMEILGISFPEAIEELAENARIALPRDWQEGAPSSEEEKRRAASREKLALAFKLNRFAAGFFHQRLGTFALAQDYLGKRGIAPGGEFERAFYLGAAADSWDDLARHLVAKKAPLELAVELGLIRPSTKAPKVSDGPRHFDLFRNRVLFPILNLRGKVAGFGGRVLSQDTPKYLNSTESLVFQKGKLAFGLYQAQKHIREQDEVILVEGYFDVLALHLAGFKNVVATCGTSLTPDHLHLFKRFASKITLLFDGDSAGVAATRRAMEIGLDFGLVIYGAQMPQGLDPDEVLLDPKTGLISSSGQEQMKEILGASQPLLDAKIAEAMRSAMAGPEERTQSLKQIGTWLSRFQDPVGKEVRAQQVQKQMGISPYLMSEVMGQGKGKAISTGSEPGKGAGSAIRTQISSFPKPKKGGASPEKSRNSKLPPADKVLMAGILYGRDFFQVFMEMEDRLPSKMTLGDLFESAAARDFIRMLLERPGYLEKLKSAPELLFEQDLDIQVRSTLTEVLLSNSPSIALEDFRAALVRSLARNWARFSQRIKEAITEAEVKKDTNVHVQLMKEYLDVQRKMKEFSNFYDEE